MRKEVGAALADNFEGFGNDFAAFLGQVSARRTLLDKCNHSGILTMTIISPAQMRLDELLTQIGTRENFGLVIGYDDQPIWQVVIEEDAAPIMIEIDADRHVAIFSSEIGTPKEECVERVNALVLNFSHLYASTAGARVSRSQADGIYSLVADHGLDGLSQQNLGRGLRRFAIMCFGWRKIMAGPTSAESAYDPLSRFDARYLPA